MVSVRKKMGNEYTSDSIIQLGITTCAPSQFQLSSISQSKNKINSGKQQIEIFFNVIKLG